MNSLRICTLSMKNSVKIEEDPFVHDLNTISKNWLPPLPNSKHRGQRPLPLPSASMVSSQDGG